MVKYKPLILELISKLKLKSLPLSSLSGYFQPSYNLKISLKEENNNLEEYLLTHLPNETWEKIIYPIKFLSKLKFPPE